MEERFKEAEQIDTEPFDPDVLQEIYVRPYATDVYMTDPFTLLLFHYFELFDRKYGTSITERVSIGRVIGNSEYYDLWYQEAAYLLEDAMYDSGWCMDAVSTEYLREHLEEAKKSEESDNWFQEGYRNCLDTVLYDCFLKDALLAESETMESMMEGLDEGHLVIVWNPELDAYMRFREEHPDMIEAVCKDEDQWIVKLEEDIWEPYMAFYQCERKKIHGKSYCSVVLGYDGYSCVSFEAINPNWICKAVKLYKMLQLANEKLACFQIGRKKKSAA